VGDTVGDPFKDTSSVAMNPIIKFTTLFGLLAVELAIQLDPSTRGLLAGVFGATTLFFVWRSFYGMRITAAAAEGESEAAPSESSA
jgi:K(+)-stimulated pyrophosphate-energized sodium pump